MSSNIKQIQELVKTEMEDIDEELNFYNQQGISVPQLHHGIFAGKKLAYEKVLEFIEDMEETQEENK